MSVTTNLALNEPAYNSTSPTWDQPLNYNATILDQMYGNTTGVAVSTSGSTTNTNITAPSATAAGSTSQAMRFNLTGALAANQNVLLPQSVAGMWVVSNNTTNAFTVTLGSNNGSNVAAGTTVACPQGFSIIVYCDGTNVKKADDGLISSNFSTLTVTGNTYTATTSGNLFVGATTTGWPAGNIVLGNTAAIGFKGVGGNFTTNLYYDSGWKYETTAAAAFYTQDTGVHTFGYAASGTAAAAATLVSALRLGAAGQIGVGTSSSYGTSGQVLISGGASAAPSWGSAGIGTSAQTWQAVTRTSGTTYTNSTGAGIMVAVNQTYVAGTGSLSVVVGGVTIFTYSNGGGGMVAPVSFIVPDTATYVITYSGYSATIKELR